MIGKRKQRRRATRRTHFERLESRQMLAAAPPDYLFIGDAATNTIQKFDAHSGNSAGTFVDAGQFLGPRGMAFHAGNLLVVNQNSNTPFNGEVLRFNGTTGSAMTPPVPQSHSQAPFAPRGVVVQDNVLYVADFEGAPTPRIAKYNATTGAFLGNLVPTGFSGEFRPRGLVFGPDGKLYVSVFSPATFESGDPAGYILRFQDTSTGAFDVIAANNGDGIQQTGEISNLHNPEGIVFGPNGRLYVTTFRVGSSDNGILVIDVGTKTQVDSMSLGQHYAQAMLFGPDGELLVPITGDGADSGSVRAYNVATKNFSTFVPSGSGSLFNPWFLTFTQTNPATLAYQPWHNFVNSVDVDGSGQLIPLDALLVINELNQRTVSNAQGTLPNSRSTSTYYYDVTGDGSVFPIDALQVINALNTVGIGEGERPSTLSTTSSAATVSPLESTITVRTTPSPAAPRALATTSGEPKPSGVAADQFASTNFRGNAIASIDRRPHAETVEPSTRVLPSEVVPEPAGPIAPRP